MLASGRTWCWEFKVSRAQTDPQKSTKLSEYCQSQVVKVRIVGKIVNDPIEGFSFPVIIGEGSNAKVHMVQAPANYDPASPDPIQWGHGSRVAGPNIWLFRKYAVIVETAGEESAEILLRVKHMVLKEEQELSRIANEVSAFENMSRISNSQRGKIPEAVRLFVWQRDEGRCSRCGRQEKLEFDHIIPVVKGGANTERNIQLLCEFCNRSKGATI